MPPGHDGATPPLPRPLLSFPSTNPNNPPRPRSNSCLSGLTSKLQAASSIINSHRQSTQVGTGSRSRGLTSTVLPTIANLNPNINGQSTTSTLPIKTQSPRHSASGGSYFASQPGASGIEARSPAQKRPPASRSSHGIETSNGPPPALSTQRTYSAENTWRIQPPLDISSIYPQLTRRTLATLDAENLARRDTTDYAVPDSNISISDERKANLLKKVATTPIVTDEKATATFTQSQNSQTLIVDEGTKHQIESSKGAMSQDKALSDHTHQSNQDEERLSQSSQEDLFHDTRSQDDQPVLANEEEEDRTLQDPGDNTPRRKSTSLAGDINRTKEVGERLSQSSQEDLFLDIANTDNTAETETDTLSPSVRYLQSRSAVANYRKSLPHDIGPSYKIAPLSSSRTPEKAQPTFLEHVPSNLTEAQQRPNLNDSSQSQTLREARQYSASAHPLDQRHRPRMSSSTQKVPFNPSRGFVNRESSPESPQNHGRRTSLAESATGIPSRSYKLSNLSRTTNGQHESSPLIVRSMSRTEQEASIVTPRVEGTMSTVSTNAPSTVWDELDDLRSRIRRLELTGKMPASSDAAISAATGERPATATTTMTTMSSSPKHDRDATSVSPEASVVDGLEDSKAYQLLTSALANSKSTISPALYKSLEAMVGDTIEMSRMTYNRFTAGSISNPIDKQLRRKASNMCRSLTELCISLSNKPELLYNTPNSRLGSSNNTQLQRLGSTDERRIQRDVSVDIDPDSSSRALSRLEARRSSLLGSSFPSPGTSMITRERVLDLATPTQEFPSPTFVPRRTSTALERIRRPPDSNSETPDRPHSRALTEIGSSRSASSFHRQLPSREYISQRSPSVASSLPRKPYFSVLSEFPTTPPMQPNKRRYLERSTPLSADTAWAKDIRPRVASLGGYEGIAMRQRARSVGERMVEVIRQESVRQEKDEEKKAG